MTAIVTPQNKKRPLQLDHCRVALKMSGIQFLHLGVKASAGFYFGSHFGGSVSCTRTPASFPHTTTIHGFPRL
jgi:hypothetical protein